MFADTFETDKGWTRNPNATDTATLGVWERGDPQATSSSGVKQQGTTVSGVTVNLNAFAGQTIRILVEAADAAGASLVEEATDDVKIVWQ